MKNKDVTSEVKFGSVDDECLPMVECVCGQKFSFWDFVISIYDDKERINPCPNCGRKFFFRNAIRVYEVTE